MGRRRRGVARRRRRKRTRLRGNFRAVLVSHAHCNGRRPGCFQAQETTPESCAYRINSKCLPVLTVFVIITIIQTMIGKTFPLVTARSSGAEPKPKELGKHLHWNGETDNSLGSEWEVGEDTTLIPSGNCGQEADDYTVCHRVF